MNRPLVIIGDSLLDIDVVGEVTRLAPDAPVPVLSQPTEDPRPGGAALCAAIAARRQREDAPAVVLISPIAGDREANALIAVLGPGVDVIAVPWAGTTPVKSRIRAGRHAVARLDRGGTPGELGDVPQSALDAVTQAGAVLVADYGNGATAHPPLRALISAAAGRIPVVWDPHSRGSSPVGGVTLVTPNRAEAAAATATIHGDDLPAVQRRATLLRDRWSAGAVAITLGAEGALLSLGTAVPLVVPAPVVSGGDVCGAGDCFAVTAAQALAAGALPTEAVTAAVVAAAAFVARGGAACFGQGFGQRPAYALPADPTVADAAETAERLTAAVWGTGGTVVATGGCFDLLHAGHIATLEAARRLGNCLIVCLNSDDSVRRLKGPSRPLQSAADRARILRALRCVDAVVEFDEDTPARVLRRLRPDLWVKGGDYTASTLPEAAVLAEWGGQVVAVPYLPERSTSTLVTHARGTAGEMGVR